MAMKNHTHIEHSATPGLGPVHPERYAAARRSTLVSIAVNLALTLMQLLAGFFAHSKSLMADGLHSLSDLVADILVLYANRHANKHADAEHPYGHARIETAASLILGAALAVLGVGLLFAAGMRLQHPEQMAPVHPWALAAALLALLIKEGLFRYMLTVARRVHSQMLEANAWHARSDAASSLVVVIGIVGNLMGYTFFDLLAAAVVGGMIAWMGMGFAREALAELVDTALDPEEVRAIGDTLKATPGVLGLHELRTRRMADHALVDAHVLVDPRISVSEGHYIAEAARAAVLRKHPVQDVLVHIDPEDDLQNKPNAHLPPRTVLLQHLAACCGAAFDPQQDRVVLHYLNGNAEVEILLADAARLPALQQRVADWPADDPWLRSVRIYSAAP